MFLLELARIYVRTHSNVSNARVQNNPYGIRGYDADAIGVVKLPVGNGKQNFGGCT